MKAKKGLSKTLRKHIKNYTPSKNHWFFIKTYNYAKTLENYNEHPTSATTYKRFHQNVCIHLKRSKSNEWKKASH